MSNGIKRNQSVTNPVTYLIKKIIEDPIPFLFFGILIGIKIYSFLKEIDIVFTLVSVMYGIDHSLGGIKAILFKSEVLHSIYAIVAILFDAIIILSYVIRTKPSGDHGKAQGFMERWYPIITVLLPMIVFTYFVVFGPIPLESDPLFHTLYQSFTFIYSTKMAGIFFSLIGCILSIVALWKLKASFSIMVEVRQLVTTGMYKYMRHPLYFSELTHALGTVLLLPNSITIPVYIIFFTMQVIRAKFEERKFLELIPEYAAYKARTGFLFPKFRPAMKKQEITQKSYETP